MSGAFSERDWSRFDYWSIVGCHGVAVVNAAHTQTYRAWLERNDYAVRSVDFGGGLDPAIETLGKLLRWEEQFGYVLTGDNVNLDAINDAFRDGFDPPMRPGTRAVFELMNADAAYAENARFFTELLSIAADHSLQQLALGARFFTTLLLDSKSPLIGQRYDSLSVPHPFRGVSRDNPFS